MVLFALESAKVCRAKTATGFAAGVGTYNTTGVKKARQQDLVVEAWVSAK